jgi:hypothetical protein
MLIRIAGTLENYDVMLLTWISFSDKKRNFMLHKSLAGGFLRFEIIRDGAFVADWPFILSFTPYGKSLTLHSVLTSLGARMFHQKALA